jgi:hypothetical protein
MNPKFSPAKLRFAALAIVLSCFMSYIGQPLIHGNDQAINVIVTVFSVLAGVLVAIIAVIGDIILLPLGTWRAVEVGRSILDNRLIRHKWLFIAYLVTLALIFFALLTAKAFPDWCVWLERFFLFFAAFSFLLSLQLPSTLVQTQREHIDAVIEQLKRTDRD